MNRRRTELGGPLPETGREEMPGWRQLYSRCWTEARSGAKTRAAWGCLASVACLLLLALLLRDPRIHARIQHIELQRTGVQHLVVKRLDVEFVAQGLLRTRAQLKDFQLPRLVGKR